MTPRNQSLDVLRGIAVLMVIVCHLYPHGTFEHWGLIGVDLFFVLSGFLISGLLFTEYQKTQRIAVGRFLIRRGFKIWPSFYVFMAVIGVTVVRFHLPRAPYGLALIFLQGYFPLGGPITTFHTWSLAVEEHFYLLLPMLFVAMTAINKREPFKRIPIIFAVLAVGCLILRILSGAPPEQINAETHLRVDSLFAGVLLAYLFHFRPEIFRKINRPYWLIPAAVLCVPEFVFSGHTRLIQTVGHSFMFLAFTVLVAWSLDRQVRQLLKPVADIGRYSYSIYLWHLPIALIFSTMSATFLPLGMALCIAVGIVMAELVEIPMLRVRERLFPKASVDLNYHKPFNLIVKCEAS